MNGEKAPYGVVSYDGVDLYHGECLAVMDELIQRGVKVDAIITDPPYGTTACKWDSVIPFDAMWERLNQLIKPNGAIVLFGSEPFSSMLRMSNLKNYKYDWKWKKEQGVGFQIAKYRPMMETEDIMVFCDKNKSPFYKPQMIPLETPKIEKFAASKSGSVPIANLNKGERVVTHRYPKNVIEVTRDRGFHPTQKPVALMEYLIKTYTNEGELVLDFTMGSGTTCVAAYNTSRKCIGIEMDDKYFEVAKQRVSDAINTKASQLF